mmetsp:Transcript_89365/g.251653  ORF Transcript_89365/g.251653 Transcript_89365/m.251653 type:complete len:332 (-) Transcript_89365:155-1150(-)
MGTNVDAGAGAGMGEDLDVGAGMPASALQTACATLRPSAPVDVDVEVEVDAAIGADVGVDVDVDAGPWAGRRSGATLAPDTAASARRGTRMARLSSSRRSRGNEFINSRLSRPWRARISRNRDMCAGCNAVWDALGVPVTRSMSAAAQSLCGSSVVCLALVACSALESGFEKRPAAGGKVIRCDSRASPSRVSALGASVAGSLSTAAAASAVAGEAMPERRPSQGARSAALQDCNGSRRGRLPTSAWKAALNCRSTSCSSSAAGQTLASRVALVERFRTTGLCRRLRSLSSRGEIPAVESRGALPPRRLFSSNCHAWRTRRNRSGSPPLSG